MRHLCDAAYPSAALARRGVQVGLHHPHRPRPGRATPERYAGCLGMVCARRLLRGHLSVTGAMPAAGWSASCTDFQTWPYHGESLSADGAATRVPVGAFGACLVPSMTL